MGDDTASVRSRMRGVFDAVSIRAFVQGGSTQAYLRLLRGTEKGEEV